MPLQLLPHISSGGDHKQMPIIFGTTNRTVPDTPDLAGSPTYKRYIVHVNENDLKLLDFESKAHRWKISFSLKIMHYQNIV